MPFMGIPTFLKIHIAQARQGGADSYWQVGYHFAIHLGSQSIPLEEAAEDDEEAAIEAFWEAFESTSEREKKIRRWLKRHTPRIAQAIPSRRMATFLAGIDAAWEEGRLSL